MSVELKTIKNTGKKGVDLQLTEYSGGKEKGVMIQLMQGLGSIINLDEPGCIQLTIKDAYYVSIELMEWIKIRTHENAEKLKAEIKKHQELKTTLIQDAVDCEKFIAELKIIEIPIRLLK